MHLLYAVKSFADFELLIAFEVDLPTMTVYSRSQVSKQGARKDLNSGVIINCNEHQNTCKTDSLNGFGGAMICITHSSSISQTKPRSES